MQSQDHQEPPAETSDTASNEPPVYAITPEWQTSTTPPITLSQEASHLPSSSTSATLAEPTIDQDPDAPLLPPSPTEPMACTVDTAATHSSATADTEVVDNPQVAALRAMFPDFDNTVLHSVLDSVDGSEDRAIDLLLGMSDPDFVSSPQAAPPPPVSNDTSMDEQLARQLALEDEEDRQRGRRSYATGQSWPRRDVAPAEQAQVPYEPRHQNPQQSGYVTGSERGDFQDFQETMNRLAESGKRTFASIVSKVKAKINEFDQGSGPSSTSNPVYPPTASFQNPSDVTTQIDSTSPYGQSGPQIQLQAPMDRHTATEVYGAGAPAVGGGGEWTTASGNTASREIRGYDIGEMESTPQRNASLEATQYKPAAEPPTTPPALPRGNSSDTAIPKPPSTMSGSPINAAKLGLLPKRPVSLLGSQPPSEQRIQPPDDDNDSLEYVENPFEEDRR